MMRILEWEGRREEGRMRVESRRRMIALLKDSSCEQIRDTSWERRRCMLSDTTWHTYTKIHELRHTYLILGCHIGSGLNQYQSDFIVTLDDG
jgi:hypothetical protein